MTLSYRSLDLKSLSASDRVKIEQYLESLSIPLSDFQPTGTETYHAEVALESDQIVGLLILTLYAAAQEVRFPLFHVERHFETIGLKLMQNALAYLKTTPAKFLEFIYKAWEVDLSALESIFSKTGWDPPKILTSRYFFNQRSFHPEWFFSPYPILSPDFKIIAWEDLTKPDLATIQEKTKDNSFLNPQDEKHPIAFMNSLVLKRRDAIVGWIAVHRISPKLIRFSSFYIDPAFRQSGEAVNLLKESIRRYFIQEIDTIALAEINERYSPYLWKAFVSKRLAPFAFQIEAIKSCFKVL